MQFKDHKIGGKYVIGPKIGGGSFGQVYLVNVPGTTEIYALKKEEQKTKHPQLLSQARIIKSLNPQIGFPNIYWQGTENKSNLIVLDMLGPSLEDLYTICGKKFSLKTTLILADQMIQRIEYLHSKNFIHRDIKPENFLMGLGSNSHILHIIDFGLSKKFRDVKTHQHIPYKQNKNLTGTARYASINAHLGIQQSRRDDLQAIGYVLLYFAQGYLPWQGIRANNKVEKYQKIMQKKMTVPVQIQCKGLPIQFSIYLNYCRSLKFDEKPDYMFLRKTLYDIFQKLNFRPDYNYDWCNLESSKEYNNGKISINIKMRNQINKNDSNSSQQQKRQAREMEQKPRQKMNFEQESLEEQQIVLQMESGQENISAQLMQQSKMKILDKSYEINLQQKKNRLLWD